MEPLMSSPLECYRDRYNVYLRNSGHHQACKNIIYKGIPQVVKRLRDGKPSRDFNILSVGSGNGAMDLEVLSAAFAVLPSDVSVENTAVEPNEQEIDDYRKAVANSREHPDLSRAKFDWFPETFEGLLKKERVPNQFDLVHFVYSVYYLENVEEALVYCYKYVLRDRGAIVCILKSAADFLSELSVRFARDGLVHSEGASSSHDDAELLSTAKRHGWQHESICVPFDLDLTEIFKEESREGDLLLDFVTHYVDFRKTASPTLLNEVMRFMEEKCKVGQDGSRSVEKASVMVVIYKGCDLN